MFFDGDQPHERKGNFAVSRDAIRATVGVTLALVRVRVDRRPRLPFKPAGEGDRSSSGC